VKHHLHQINGSVLIQFSLRGDSVKQVYRFNEKGEYIEPVLIFPDKDGNYNIPEDCTDKPLPQPNWRPIFDKEKGEWIETITQEELEQLQSRPQEQAISLEELKERINLMQSALDDLILGGM
jgi:hypothetical protein